MITATLRRPIVLLILVAMQAACTAWQYEVASCDPGASIDICNRLNTADGINPTTACSGIWRCDPNTNTCQPSVRDQDRDGDLPIECGGTDCDDLDPQLNGPRGTCDCQRLLNPPTGCTVGTGSCFSKGQWTCPSGAPKCDAQIKSPPAPPAWNTTEVSPSNPTWDWNCDGIIEESCALTDKVNGPKIPCTISHCSQPTKDRIQAEMAKPSPDIDLICDKYCQENGEFLRCKDGVGVTDDFLINCFGAGDSPAQPTGECGKIVIACRCVSAFAWCYRYPGTPKLGYVYCR